MTVKVREESVRTTTRLDDGYLGWGLQSGAPFVHFVSANLGPFGAVNFQHGVAHDLVSDINLIK
jgi:hypothetical protein